MSAVRSRYSATAGLPFDADELESRLVWIWGSPRSGSTWLLQQLCHPLEPDVREPAGFRPIDEYASPPARGFDAIPVDESFIPNHLAPAFGDPIPYRDIYVPATLNNYASRHAGYALSQAFEDAWRPEFRRLALVRLHSIAERAAENGIRLGEAPLTIIKEVNGSHAADLLMSLLPRSRMLFLVRDGRDVADSLLAAYAPGGFLARNQARSLDTPEERREALRWACRLWACNVDVTLKAHEAHAPKLRRIVRYEDLVTDTSGTLGPLFEWLGLERDAAWLDRMVKERSFSAVPVGRRGEGRRARSASPGRWRENLSDEEQLIASEILGDRLVHLGYAA